MLTSQPQATSSVTDLQAITTPSHRGFVLSVTLDTSTVVLYGAVLPTAAQACTFQSGAAGATWLRNAAPEQPVGANPGHTVLSTVLFNHDGVVYHASLLKEGPATLVVFTPVTVSTLVGAPPACGVRAHHECRDRGCLCCCMAGIAGRVYAWKATAVVCASAAVGGATTVDDNHITPAADSQRVFRVAR